MADRDSKPAHKVGLRGRRVAARIIAGGAALLRLA